jgi:hypothetical protein
VVVVLGGIWSLAVMVLLIVVAGQVAVDIIQGTLQAAPVAQVCLLSDIQ